MKLEQFEEPTITAAAFPTNLPPGRDGKVLFRQNCGDATQLRNRQAVII
jgi:hypothetical protein